MWAAAQGCPAAELCVQLPRHEGEGAFMANESSELSAEQNQKTNTAKLTSSMAA